VKEGSKVQAEGGSVVWLPAYHLTECLWYCDPLDDDSMGVNLGWLSGGISIMKLIWLLCVIESAFWRSRWSILAVRDRTKGTAPVCCRRPQSKWHVGVFLIVLYIYKKWCAVIMVCQAMDNKKV